MSYCQNEKISLNSALLQQSCNVYKELEGVYQTLHTNLTSSPKTFLSISQRITELQQRSQEIDDGIELSPQEKNDPIVKELLGKREQLLQKLIQTNRCITKNVGNIKSHLSHEMSSMNINRKAINSYKPMNSAKNSIINNSF